MPFLVLHFQFVGVYSCCFSVKRVGCSYKTTEDVEKNKKHSEPEPVTQAANRQNILHQTYCRYFYHAVLQADWNCIF